VTSLEPRVAAAFEGERGARLAAALFGGFAVAAAVLLLWLNRGTSFWNDQLTWFAGLSGSNDFESILAPHNSHLIGTTRLVYLAVNELVGPDYLVFRILGVAGVLLAAALFFVWARRRIAPGWALLPAILLLFYGTAWQHVVGPIGFTMTFSIALGLAALLAVERGDRRGDVLACLLVTLSVFSYTVGLAYLVGVAIMVLLRSDRLRRAWIFLIPLLLYAAWWIWAQKFDQGRADAGNLTNLVEFFARSMSANSGGITGVNIPWLRIFDPDQIIDARASALGWIVGAALTGALLWRILKGSLPRSFWAALGVLVTFWLAAGVADVHVEGETNANAIRYMFPGSLALLLVLVAAVSGSRIGGSRAYALVGVFAFSLAMNLVFLNDGADYLREQGAASRVELTMLELRAGLEPGAEGPRPIAPDPEAVADLTDYTKSAPSKYLEAVSRYGSPALTLDELRHQPPAERATADLALIGSGGAAFLADAGDGVPGRPCARVAGDDGPDELAPGADWIRATGGDGTPVPLSLSRFGDPPGIPLGEATAATWSILATAGDAAGERWRLTIPPGTGLRACPPAPAGQR
jgi:hypothetical protein